MAKVSVIIPSRASDPSSVDAIMLPKTVDDLLEKGNDIEIIAVLDGYWPNPPLKDDKRLIVLHRGNGYGNESGYKCWCRNSIW